MMMMMMSVVQTGLAAVSGVAIGTCAFERCLTLPVTAAPRTHSCKNISNSQNSIKVTSESYSVQNLRKEDDPVSIVKESVGYNCACKSRFPCSFGQKIKAVTDKL